MANILTKRLGLLISVILLGMQVLYDSQPSNNLYVVLLENDFHAVEKSDCNSEWGNEGLRGESVPNNHLHVFLTQV